MAESVLVHFLFPVGMRYGGAGLIPSPGSSLNEEGEPAIMWGQGTPDGNLSPFNLVNKGSLYLSVNQADDVTAFYIKVDEGGETGAADWPRVFVENHALIDTGDLAAAAAIVSGQILDGTLLNVDVNASAAIAYSKLNLTGAVLVEDLENNAKSNIFVSPVLVDISAADSEAVIFHAVAALTLTEIGLIWEEASADDTGVHEGDVTIGTTTGGAEIVAATAYGDAAAAGSYQALSFASGAMAAGTSMFASHDQSTGAGTYRIQFKYDLDS